MLNGVKLAEDKCCDLDYNRPRWLRNRYVKEAVEDIVALQECQCHSPIFTAPGSQTLGATVPAVKRFSTRFEGIHDLAHRIIEKARHYAVQNPR